MIEWSVSSSALILVIAALRRILKGKLSLRLQYAMWGLALVRILLPVSLFDSSLSILNVMPADETERVGETVVGYRDFVGPDLAVAEPDPGLPPEEREEQYEENLAQWREEMAEAREDRANWTPVTLEEAARALLAAGGMAVGLWFLMVNLRFGRRLKRTRTAVETGGYPLPVYRSALVETPCLFGLFRPAVYLTDEVKGEEAIGHVLAHELTHYRHGDHIWAALRCLCLAAHWYNPLVWLAAVLSRRDGELACDEGTIGRIGEEARAAYGRTLIGLTCRRRGVSALSLTATTMTGSKGGIRERVILIAKKPVTKRWALALALVLAAVAAGCTFTGAKGEDSSGPAGQAGETAGQPGVVGDVPSPEPSGSGGSDIGPDGWSEEDRSRWAEETDWLGLSVDTPNNLDFDGIGQLWSKTCAANYTDASEDNPARCTDAEAFLCELASETLTSSPKKLLFIVRIACKPVDAERFIADVHGMADQADGKEYPQYEGWYFVSRFVVLEWEEPSAWMCTDVGTGGYGGWGWLNYDDRSFESLIYELSLGDGSGDLGEFLLRTMYFADWEALSRQYRQEVWDSLWAQLDEACIGAERYYGPEPDRMWPDVYPDDQLYRNLYVMLAALRPDAPSRLGGILAKQYEHDPAVFQAALVQLTVSEREELAERYAVSLGGLGVAPRVTVSIVGEAGVLDPLEDGEAAALLAEASAAGLPREVVELLRPARESLWLDTLIPLASEGSVTLYGVVEVETVEWEPGWSFSDRGLILRWGDELAYFPLSWYGNIWSGGNPGLVVDDFDGDGADEAAVILDTGHGTGVSVSNLYIFEEGTMTYAVPDYSTLDIDVSFDPARYEVTLTSGSSSVTVTPNAYWWEKSGEVSCGMVVHFSYEDGQLYCNAGLDFSGVTADYAAYVTAPVVWENGGYCLGEPSALRAADTVN